MQRAELGDAVLDVVKRVQENVELLVPIFGPGALVAAPVDAAAEAIHQAVPGVVALGDRVAGVQVEPVLERIDRGDPREDEHDALEVGDPRTAHFLCVVKLAEVFAAEQLHRHRGDFAKLDRRVAVRVQRLVLASHGVKRMSGLVQQRLDVALHADGVHENERQPRLGQ